MKEKKISIREWIEKFNNKEFEVNDIDTQIEAGWYDWFCQDKSLVAKTKNMGGIIKKIINKDLLDDYYIFFKNNCPVCGPLYDSFSICSINSGNTLYFISIGDSRENNKYCVYGRQNNFEECLFCTDDRKELIKFINY